METELDFIDYLKSLESKPTGKLYLLLLPGQSLVGTFARGAAIPRFRDAFSFYGMAKSFMGDGPEKDMFYYLVRFDSVLAISEITPDEGASAPLPAP